MDRKARESMARVTKRCQGSQPRTWYIWLIAVGGFGIFFHFILDLGRLSVWGIGSWLYLLGAIAIVVGGVLFIKPPTPSATPPIR